MSVWMCICCVCVCMCTYVCVTVCACVCVASTHHLQGTLALLKRYYETDPILNPLKPPKRPPIRNVYCVYGTTHTHTHLHALC